jgi:hypothetical protein
MASYIAPDEKSTHWLIDKGDEPAAEYKAGILP